MSVNFNFDNTYKNLPSIFFTEEKPEYVPNPKLILWNNNLAEQLNLNTSTKNELAEIFCGNNLPENSAKIAMAYAGHQFGYFNMLGDGRAILIGEQITQNGERFDIQLKGSGATSFSRRGDGKATLSAMLREYLISESMHHLNIDTTRSLAVISTGEKVYRDFVHDGAILTRVAKSHIRVGHFEFAKNYTDKQNLNLLLDYTIKRHYPEILENSRENKASAFLEKVMFKQIDLIVQWLRVGFIHGVMNTDNMSICGETLDFGPCAFMNTYNPNTVFSSIDTGGRYSFGNQPNIGQWNIACLADAVMSLISDDEEEAISIIKEILYGFPIHFEKKYFDMMAKKLGIEKFELDDKKIVNDFLDILYEEKLDYTNSFYSLQFAIEDVNKISNSPRLNYWLTEWKNRISKNSNGIKTAVALMQKSNPAFIPRNHIVEEALEKACLHNDMGLYNSLLLVLQNPYTFFEEYKNYQTSKEVIGYKTFCNT